jgi:hypothetical protein
LLPKATPNGVAFFWRISHGDGSSDGYLSAKLAWHSPRGEPGKYREPGGM